MTLAPPPIDQDARCLGCGYLLRGLAEHRCPECGRAFDPGDITTFDSPRHGAAARRAMLLEFIPLLAFLATVTLMATAVLTVTLSWTRPEPWIVWIAIFIVGVGLWVRGRVRKRILAGRPDPDRSSERVATILIALFIMLYVLPVSARGWSCPHGTAVGVGGIGIAWSGGGPCRNTVTSLRSWHVAGDFYIWIGL
jgi:hypothetical protein